MEELVKRLAKTRQDLELAALCRDALYDEATTTPQWHAYEEQRTEVEQLKLEVQAADAELREGALAEHQVTGAKHLFGGVQVKMFTVISYDPDKAKSYCINHGLQAALKLDAKVFERAVPALGLDWVTVEQEPRATIPTDLSAYVPAPGLEPVLEVAVIECVPA